MNTAQQYSFGTLVRKPDSRQFLANDLPLTILCLAGLIVAGMDGIFLGNVLFWFSSAIAVCLVYRCLYLRDIQLMPPKFWRGISSEGSICQSDINESEKLDSHGLKTCIFDQ